MLDFKIRFNAKWSWLPYSDKVSAAKDWKHHYFYAGWGCVRATWKREKVMWG